MRLLIMWYAPLPTVYAPMMEKVVGIYLGLMVTKILTAKGRVALYLRK